MKRFKIGNFSIDEKNERIIQEQLRKVDENRLEFFAHFTVLIIAVIILLDFLYFNEALRYFYLSFDSALWFASLLLIVFAYLSRKRRTKTVLFIKEKIFQVFPLFVFLWATAICALDTNSILNIITFYFILFLFAFAVITPLKTLLLYYALITIEFIVLSLIVDKPIISENSIIMVMVCVLILPFYHSFRSNRVNSQAALVLLNETNTNLEKEVESRTRELVLVNDNLNDEITQRKIVESKIRETLKIAESNNQLKTEFLSNISHEIRTPLNAIIGFSEIITEDSIPNERKKEFKDLIETNTGFLLATIDDIFDASLVKTEQITPIVKPFPVIDFFESLKPDINSIATKYNNPHIKLDIIKENIDVIISTDEYYLKKALLRLIDNAYKFTEKGKVKIGVTIDNDTISLYVSDTGIGICEKDFIKIFEPFVQGDGSFTRDFGGSGLGLTIAKGITNALGATLNFTTKVGTGSNFVISFDKSIIQNY